MQIIKSDAIPENELLIIPSKIQAEKGDLKISFELQDDDFENNTITCHIEQVVSFPTLRQ